MSASTPETLPPAVFRVIVMVVRRANMARSVSHAAAPALSVMVRKGSESCCRGSHGLVAAAAGGVDNVYSGRERDEAFFQPSGFLVVPVVEGGRVRDRLEVLTLRGDKIAARGDQGVNVADCVEGLSGDGADLVSVGFDPPFVAPREEALGGGDLACVVQRVQGGLRVGRVGGGCCGWRVGASGGGGRERECGNQGGDAACEGVHTVVSLRFLVVDGENTKAATGRAMPLVAVFG